jgi:hypothetical protein
LDKPSALCRRTSRIFRIGNISWGIPRSLLKGSEAMPIRGSPNGAAALAMSSSWGNLINAEASQTAFQPVDNARALADQVLMVPVWLVIILLLDSTHPAMVSLAAQPTDKGTL